MSAPAPEITSRLTTDLYTGGEFQAGTGEVLVDTNPFDETTIAEFSGAAPADVDAAVQAARTAFTGDWGALAPEERAALLHRLADLVDRDAELLARLESFDIGKTLFLPTVVDVPNAAATLRYFAGWADKLAGTVLPTPPHAGRPTHSYTLREPLGVVGAIVPWNSPLMIGTWKLAAALASGNTIVIKSPELAPLSLGHLARLVDEAGFPAGTVNVLPGLGSVAGEALVQHHGVDKISFTGSTEVGRHIAEVAGRSFKKLTLELGGKSPQIILADADIAAAIAGCATGLFALQGEVCVAGTRILVHRSLYEQVTDGLVEAANAQVLGNPLDEGTTIGPLVTAKQRDRVEGYISSGIAAGAKRAAGGAYDGSGYFVRPTIFSGATNDLEIAQEEIFGPVGTVIAFDDPDEAVRLANATRYGLAASIWTRDVSQAHDMAKRVSAGSVWVNGWGLAHPSLPWGGFKESGFGQELGLGGLLANTREKAVSILL